MNCLRLFILSILLIVPLMSSASNGWQDYLTVTSNFFEEVNDAHRIVLTMERPFHECGWNTAANINLNVVGPDAFETLTSVVLSAWVADKKLSLNVDGCLGNRANVKGLRISK
ncbi:MAG: hypothetical protein ABW086_11435 [Sedimenticola sp.]